MPRTRLLFIALAGVLLYGLAVVYLSGWLAAITVPAAYFERFGREHRELALGLLNLLTWALPVLTAVMLGAAGVLRMSRVLPQRQAVLALGLGMLLGWLGWQMVAAFSLTAHPDAPLSLGQALLLTSWPAWWYAPNALAPWLGLVLAAVWALRRPGARTST